MKEVKGFLRQSAWMIVATVGGGVAMILVHAVVRAKAGPDAYSEFKALLSSFYVIAAASGGLWALFAQRTASAVTEEQLRAVARGARHLAAAILLVWLLLAAIMYWQFPTLISLWKVTHPAALWATWGLGLATLWTAIARGLVQGRQNFRSLGAVAILDGFGRFVAVYVIVAILGGLAAGAIFGAVLGCLAALAVGLWGSHEVWCKPGLPFPWKSWFSAFVPMTMAAAGIQIMQQYDNMFWQALIPEDRWAEWNLGALYSPAQTVGFGITQFTIPLALVLLPRVARSVALGEKSNTVQLAALCTLILGGGGALVCTVLPTLPLQIMFFGTPDNWAAAPLVPWFAWAMLLLTLAWIYLNDLFARARFAVTPWVLGIALAYVGTLWLCRSHLLSMEVGAAYRLGVQILGAFNLLMLVVAAIFHRRVCRGT